MKFFRHRHFPVYAAVGGTAAALRLALWTQYAGSPLAYFHFLPGLDMQSHVHLGEIFAAGGSIFTVYRFLLGLLPLGAVIPLQLLLGVLTALLAGYCAFRLFGRRLEALLAGLFAAAYAPALIYELAFLQETVTVVIAFAAFAALLAARRRHFAPLPTAAAGALLALAGTGRPVALPFLLAVFGFLFVYLQRRPGFRRRAWFGFLGGFVAIWVAVIAFNAARGWPLPFYGGNVEYLVAVGSRDRLADWSEPETAESALAGRLVRSVVRFPVKFFMLFSIRELPDNLNYYFIRDRLPLLKLLPGPLLLWPLGAAGLLLILLFRRLFRREGLLWLYAGGVLLLVAAYYPTGRHRLILYPALALAAAWLIGQIVRDRRRRPAMLLTVAAVLGINLAFTPVPAVERPGDAFSWALALEKMSEPPEDPLDYYREAAVAAPDRRRHVMRYANGLIRRNRWPELEEFLRGIGEPRPVHRYYRALLLLAGGAPAEAAAELRQIDPAAIPELAVPYCYYLGDSLRLSGDAEGAAAAWREGLKHEPTAEQRQMLENALQIKNNI